MSDRWSYHVERKSGGSVTVTVSYTGVTTDDHVAQIEEAWDRLSTGDYVTTAAAVVAELNKRPESLSGGPA
jgi:hypothetical protein